MPTSWERLLPHACWRAFRPAPPAGLAAPDLEAVDGALEGFFEAVVADGTRRVLVAVNDADRATDTEPMLAQALAARDRVARDVRFDVLVAGGSHPLPPPAARAAHEERALGIGRDRVGSVAWHGGNVPPETLVPLGAAGPEGAAPHVHRALAEARAVLALGSVEPHYFAGLTGAHKTATIGALSRRDIARNHSHALSQRARALALDGNPVFDGIAVLARAVEAGSRRLLCVNQVLCGGREVARAAGSWRGSLDAVAPVCRASYALHLLAPADLVVARVEGPLAATLYQADKGFHNTGPAVRDGGAIVVEAPCDQGLGPSRFIEMLRAAPTLEDALARLEAGGYRLGDHKAVRLRCLAARGVRVAVVASRDLGDPVPGLPIARSREAGLAAVGIDAGTFAGSALLVEDAGCAVATAG